jgi:CxxC motif-containing protein
MGCALTVELDDSGAVTSVTGNSCPRGAQYGRDEVTNPVRTVTTSMPVSGAAHAHMVSVKTQTDVPKGKVFDVIAALAGLTAQAPVAIGDVLVHDVAGTGVDVVATSNAR